MSGNDAVTATGLPYEPRYSRVLLGIFAGMGLMVTYVETMVLPAFAQFRSFFALPFTSASFSTISWILAAYLLVGTAVVPIFGKLGDLYGKKRMLTIAMVVYAVAVSLAGFTPNLGAAVGISRPNQIYLLIAVRGVQGIGMGMFPLAFAMIPEAFPAARVGQGLGIISAMFAAGAAVGLAGGGWIAQSYGWQFTYLTVIPLAILLALLGRLLLRESPTPEQHVLDLPGVAALGSGLAMLLVGITEGAAWGWGGFAAVHWGPLPWGVPEFFLLALAAFGFFAFWEPRAKSPVIHFQALKPRNIFVSNVNGVLVGALMFFTLTTVVILAEMDVGPGLGISEFTFGLLALPSALCMLAFGPVLGSAVSRLGPKPVALIGYALMALGGVLLVLFNRNVIELSAFTVPLLTGNIAVLVSMSNTIALSVDRRELGIQTGMNQTFRNLGTAVAPVVTTALLASFTAVYFIAVRTPLGPRTVGVTAYSLEGFRVVFGIVSALSIAGLLLNLALKNYRFLADGTRSLIAEPTRTPGSTGRPSAASIGPAETVGE